MGTGIIKIKDRYFEWSTIVDAPVTCGMTLGELNEYIQETYGKSGTDELPSRMSRVFMRGTSFHNMTLDDVISGNRAGEHEACLTADEIYEKYKGDTP